jgi:hypothetical protein
MSTLDPLLVWAQGYSIQAICAKCRRKQECFAGPSKRSCLADARRQGWSMDTKSRTAVCSSCNVRSDKQAKP